MALHRFGVLSFAVLTIVGGGLAQPEPPTTPLTVEIKPIQVFHGKGNPLKFIDFSPDGKRIATGGDSRVRLWDLKTGKQIAEYVVEERQISYHALFSPDGASLACTAGNGDVVTLLDADSGKVLKRLGPHPKSIVAVQFAPNGKCVLTVCNDGRLRLWDVTSGDEISKPSFGKTEGFVSSAAFSPDGVLLAMGINDTTHVITVASGKEVCKFPRNPDNDQALVFSTDGRYLTAVCRDENEIRLWDVAERKMARTLTWETKELLNAPGTGHDKRPGTYALSFSADGRTLAAACQDGHVRVWELATGALRYQAEESTPTVVAAPAHSLLCTANLKERSIRVWSAVNPSCMQPGNLKAVQLERLWADLESQDASQAYLALLALTLAPDEAVPALAARLKPIKPVDASTLDELIVQLDDNAFDTRQAAMRQLRLLGPVAKDKLAQALEKPLSLDAQKRIGQLLDELKSPPSGDSLRAQRAIEVLECIGNQEGRRVLKELSQGATGAPVTEQAKATIKRLGKE